MPIIYDILPNKDKITYNRLFADIKNLGPSFHPTAVFTDYERTAINAIKTEYPIIILNGCLFHLTKNL